MLAEIVGGNVRRGIVRGKMSVGQYVQGENVRLPAGLHGSQEVRP